MIADHVECPEGHTDVECRAELPAPKDQMAYLCRLCLEIFYKDEPFPGSHIRFL